MNPKKSTIEKLYNRALVNSATLDPERREVEVVFATETPCFRWGWTEDYNEVLVCEKGAIRMDRVNNGLPVLDAHDNSSIFNQIGRTTDVRFEKNQAIAKIVFSQREELKGLLQDIRDGIVKDISVGYRVFKYEREENGIDKLPTYRATEWEPYEITFVPVQADVNCVVRNGDGKNEVEIVEKVKEAAEKYLEKVKRFAAKNKEIEKQIINAKSRKMITVKCPTCGHEWESAEAENYTCPECGAEFQPLAAGDDAAEAAGGSATEEGITTPVEEEVRNLSTGTVAQIRATASAQERNRLNAILVSTRAARLPDSYAIELYNSKRSLNDCRHDIIVKAAGTNPPPVNGGHRADVGNDAIDKKRNAAQNAILSRAIPGTFKLENGNYFRGMTLIEIAKELFVERGINVRGKSKGEIADMVFKQRAHSTSDFPILFEDALNKTLRADYTFAPEYWEQIARQTSVSDFRAKNFYQVETSNGMHETPEGGEIKYTTMKEAKQTIRVKKYTEGIMFTREAFINDDLNALAIIPSRFIKDWNEMRGDLVWGLIIDNVVMDDGKALFSTEHKNLLSGATSVLSEAGLTASLLAFRKQVALGGERRIRVQPKTIIVPAELEITAKKLLTAITASTTSEVNVFSSAYGIVVEPRLVNATAWYLIADPNEIEGLYYAYLDGNDGLRVNSKDDFDTDTMKYAVRGEFGVAAIDYRGLVKMVGA